MRVRVYKNLQRNCYSIKCMDKTFYPNYNKVIGHCDECQVHDAKFVVSESGRKRANKEGKRNVHAFVEGTLEYINNYRNRDGYLLLERPNSFVPSETGIPVYYNPFKTKCFMSGEQEIHSSPVVEMTQKSVYCYSHNP